MVAAGHDRAPNGGLRAVKTRKRPRLMSKSRAAQMREYAKLKKEFLAKHKKCAIWPHKKATDLHHSKGRRGKLLLDQRYWIPLCREMHSWVHSHPGEARTMSWRGIPLIAPEGEWNKQPS